jgi:hypothetical protein
MTLFVGCHWCRSAVGVDQVDLDHAQLDQELVCVPHVDDEAVERLAPGELLVLPLLALHDGAVASDSLVCGALWFPAFHDWPRHHVLRRRQSVHA